MKAPYRSHAAIFKIVSRIPRGSVATYGQIARLAGMPGHARLVGYALSALDERSPVPWHRVVNARGEISLRSRGSDGGDLQRLRLEQEGVCLDVRGRTDLERHGWLPRVRERASRRMRARD